MNRRQFLKFMGVGLATLAFPIQLKANKNEFVKPEEVAKEALATLEKTIPLQENYQWCDKCNCMHRIYSEEEFFNMVIKNAAEAFARKVDEYVIQTILSGGTL